MTRVFWKSIKDKVFDESMTLSQTLCSQYVARIFSRFVVSQLIFPFLELDIKYFDLGLPHRDATADRVTIESAEATLKYVAWFSLLASFPSDIYS